MPKSFGAVGTKLIFLFPCGVREGIYSFEPISSLKVAGSCSGRECLVLDAPEAARGDRLVNKVQADSAKTALAGIPYIKPCPIAAWLSFVIDFDII